MTDEEKSKIVALRKCGDGYKSIAKMLGLSENTVKSFCRRMAAANPKVAETVDSVCECCGKPIAQSPGRKKRLENYVYMYY